MPVVVGLVFVLGSRGCDRTDLPAQAGDYRLQNDQIRFDGENYAFAWLGADNQPHAVRTRDVRLVQDERTLLRVGPDGPVLHLAENQAVQVEARDRQGGFSTNWYPYMWGPLGGGPVIGLPPDTGGNTRSPSYRYPPTDSFGRDETLGGSVPSSRSAPPDYTRLPNARDTVAGQGGGTGGGAAATGRGASAASGQSGGTGSGSAASSKGGFSAGQNAYREDRAPDPRSIDAKPAAERSAPRVGAGGASSAGALKSPQAGSGARTAPSAPSSGSKGISGARRR